MTLRTRQLVTVLVSCGTVLLASQSAFAAGIPATRPPAGPWYTPKELNALRAYSAMSFAEQRAFLRAAGRRTAAAGGSARRLAGPWYTPSELKALIAYSNATFEEKQAILAGAAPVRARRPAGGSGNTRAVAVAGVFATMGILLLAAFALPLVRNNGRRGDGHGVDETRAAG